MDPTNPPNAHTASVPPPPPPLADNATSGNDAPPPPPSVVNDLPPEAIALASRLFDAARQGQVDIFEQALERGLSPNMTNEKGDSLIMLSSYHGHLPLTRLLLSHSADPNRLNLRLQSPLAGAIFKGEEDIVEALLDGGADPRIGEPSAIDAVGIFGQEGRWGGRMREAIGVLEEKERMNGNGVVGSEDGPAKVEGEEVTQYR